MGLGQRSLSARDLGVGPGHFGLERGLLDDEQQIALFDVTAFSKEPPVEKASHAGAQLNFLDCDYASVEADPA